MGHASADRADLPFARTPAGARTNETIRVALGAREGVGRGRFQLRIEAPDGTSFESKGPANGALLLGLYALATADADVPEGDEPSFATELRAGARAYLDEIGLYLDAVAGARRPAGKGTWRLEIASACGHKIEASGEGGDRILFGLHGLQVFRSREAEPGDDPEARYVAAVLAWLAEVGRILAAIAAEGGVDGR